MNPARECARRKNRKLYAPLRCFFFFGFLPNDGLSTSGQLWLLPGFGVLPRGGAPSKPAGVVPLRFSAVLRLVVARLVLKSRLVVVTRFRVVTWLVIAARFDAEIFVLVRRLARTLLERGVVALRSVRQRFDADIVFLVGALDLRGELIGGGR